MIKVSESSSFHPAEVFHVNHPKTNQPALHPAGAGGTAAAAYRRAGPERDHRPGRHPDGVLGGRGRRVRREPGRQLQHPDDPGDERPCHRRCRGHQSVHRPPGAQKRQGRRCTDPVCAGQLQPGGGRRGRSGPPRHPAGHLRLHRRRRHALRRDLFPALSPELPVHWPVQRRRGAVPGAGQQQGEHDVQPGDERCQHRRQRHPHLWLRDGRAGRGPRQPDLPRHCLHRGAFPAAKARLYAPHRGSCRSPAKRQAHPAHPAGGHPGRH